MTIGVLFKLTAIFRIGVPVIWDRPQCEPGWHDQHNRDYVHGGTVCELRGAGADEPEEGGDDAEQCGERHAAEEVHSDD